MLCGMSRTVLVVVVLTLVGCKKSKPAAPADAAPAKPTTMRLVASPGACTELACDEDELCCNACRIDGWYPPGAATALVKVTLAPGVPALPTEPEIDACGRPPFDLEAEVVEHGGKLVVHAWKQVPPPPGACDVKLLTRVDGAATATLDAGSEAKLEAWLINGTTQDQTFTIPDRCPGIDVSFSGFGAVDLYDASCMQGQCADTSPPTRTITVPARGRVLVEQTTLKQDLPCADAVPAGTYTIDFTVAWQGAVPVTCSGPATVTVK